MYGKITSIKSDEDFGRKSFRRKSSYTWYLCWTTNVYGNSEEGNKPGLGWIKGKTIRFRLEQMQNPQKLPNMGWLDIQINKTSQLTTNLDNSRFYFAHSFHVSPVDTDTILMKAHYGYDFVTAIEYENIIGVQFHPEKSHRFGLRLLKNFATLYQ